MSITYNLKALHIVERGVGNFGDKPLPGDTVEVECVGGFIMEVDPRTRKTTETRKRFVLGEGGALALTPNRGR